MARRLAATAASACRHTVSPKVNICFNTMRHPTASRAASVQFAAPPYAGREARHSLTGCRFRWGHWTARSCHNSRNMFMQHQKLSGTTFQAASLAPEKRFSGTASSAKDCTHTAPITRIAKATGSRTTRIIFRQQSHTAQGQWKAKRHQSIAAAGLDTTARHGSSTAS